MGAEALDPDLLTSPRRNAADIESVRRWADGLPVREPVVASVGLTEQRDGTPLVCVHFVALAHVAGEFGECPSAGIGNAKETFAAGRDPVDVADSLARRIATLEPEDVLDVWSGPAGELSPHVLALAFSSASFAARHHLGGRAYQLEIAVSDPGLGGDDPFGSGC